ncbi:unnamed protein product [Amoebophrya sp. A25]|nr:unnamed protein product [Amoebophrya sp. A25]|eukprot:GSA25T00003167001.1
MRVSSYLLALQQKVHRDPPFPNPIFLVYRVFCSCIWYGFLLLLYLLLLYLLLLFTVAVFTVAVFTVAFYLCLVSMGVPSGPTAHINHDLINYLQEGSDCTHCPQHCITSGRSKLCSDLRSGYKAVLKLLHCITSPHSLKG